MSESVIGAKSSDIVAQQKTSEGSLTITHNAWDLFANTVGHLGAIPTRHVPLWTPEAIFRNPPKELSVKLFERWKDVPWKGDVLVRVGHTAIFRDIQRIWNIDKIGGPFGFKIDNNALHAVARLLYSSLAIPFSTLATVYTKMFRANHYNPWTNTVNIYHPRMAIGMHEIGHAQFFNQNTHKTAYALFGGLPIIRSFIEYKATALAMPRFADDAERRQGQKVLEAMWGSYLAADVLTLAAPFAGPLGLAMATGTIPLIHLGKYVLESSLAGFGGSLSGHAMARVYPRQAQRFGYVFSGKKPVLADRQMLVGMARPH